MHWQHRVRWDRAQLIFRLHYAIAKLLPAYGRRLHAQSTQRYARAITGTPALAFEMTPCTRSDWQEVVTETIREVVAYQPLPQNQQDILIALEYPDDPDDDRATAWNGHRLDWWNGKTEQVVRVMAKTPHDRMRITLCTKAALVKQITAHVVAKRLGA